jgi:hypothetical protein
MSRLHRLGVCAVLLTIIFGSVRFAVGRESLREQVRDARHDNVWVEFSDLPDGAYAETIAEPDGGFTIKVDFWRNLDESELFDSLCHERAHVMVGFEHGHDAVWQAEYERLLMEHKD